MTLTEAEKQSALWQKIEKELTENLQVAREKNDGDRDIEETSSIRGEIRTLKKILGWATTPKIME